ncbi:hypothetical protein HF877_06160 [Rhodococcus sp. BL-253-APC-6A1W]|uniref:hypothetical protein n=1 Tax=Rhodococcus sp. BL-253-APC-6A1W TaxID=2725307 RepID=UPI00146F56AC|nr:hypothetical protein [Rhodococcus sp. BL-253-APC-6A1W]NMD94987.1 hypothetical protein [Rhodococcus sp. BL-253-APC-6A1W]
MYRILRESTQVEERHRQARHPSRVCPELVATAASGVFVDITKLTGATKGTYFDAYVMIDIFSRYIVGVHVQAAGIERQPAHGKRYTRRSGTGGCGRSASPRSNQARV